MFALSAAGIELGKFSLLAGALGVGIGFGLQNIVNNFISGLIIIYERPLQVGDTIEIENLLKPYFENISNLKNEGFITNPEIVNQSLLLLPLLAVCHN